jgi:hypothetical protein
MASPQRPPLVDVARFQAFGFGASPQAGGVAAPEAGAGEPATGPANGGPAAGPTGGGPAIGPEGGPAGGVLSAADIGWVGGVDGWLVGW